MKIRCPCNKCLVQPTCKECCDDFDKFITPIYIAFDKGSDYIMDIQMKLEGFFIDRIIDIVMEHIVMNILMIFLVLITGIKIHKTELCIMDDRITDWEQKTSRR